MRSRPVLIQKCSSRSEMLTTEERFATVPVIVMRYESSLQTGSPAIREAIDDLLDLRSVQIPFVLDTFLASVPRT